MAARRGIGMPRSVILFLAANPLHTSIRALDEECAAIERELRLTPGRDELELRSKWAVSVDDVMRHLLDLQPAVLHFTGAGSGQGLFLEDEHGQPQLVTSSALTRMVRAAGPARLAVLNACYSEAQAQALCEAVGCAIGMAGTVSDDAARAFAVGFYRALGHRRSVGNAFDHALAALEGKGLSMEAQPRCLARAGVDVGTLSLDAPDARDTRAIARRTASAYRGKIDFGIITVREDENAAVLRRFDGVATDDHRRRYRIRRLALPGGGEYTLAVVRCLEQGNTDAQAATHALLDDLEPRFVLVVGIAGGVPSYELSLGDVVVSSRIVDFSVEAVRDGQREYALGGGPLHPDAARLAADIGAAITDGELDGWSSPAAIAQARPLTDLAAQPRPPVAITGAIASSDRLIKDGEILASWLKMARQIVAIEMESAGIHRATHERGVPFSRCAASATWSASSAIRPGRRTPATALPRSCGRCCAPDRSSRSAADHAVAIAASRA
jgi:nucleoside phosphorylase